jgi:hypothetical protein
MDPLTVAEILLAIWVAALLFGWLPVGLLEESQHLD